MHKSQYCEAHEYFGGATLSASFQHTLSAVETGDSHGDGPLQAKEKFMHGSPMHGSHRTSDGPNRRRSAALVAAGLASLLAITGCSSAAPGPTGDVTGDLKDGGTLVVGIAGEPGLLDPTMSSTLASSGMFAAFCEYLYNAYEDGIVFPQLASGPAQFNEDNTIATIPLREDAVFADGTAMNAEAVKFSLDRHKNLPGSQRVNELDAVEEVVVVDEHTVDVHLKYPLAEGAFYTNLTARAGAIMSPTAIETLGDEGFAEAPVCVGPFKFESRIAQDNVTFVKDENYYDADSVRLDSVVYRVIPDSNIRLTNLRSGDLHVIERLSTMDMPMIAADSKLAVKTFPGQGHFNLIFNIGNVDGSTAAPGQVDTPLASDPRIRQALQMSIDRDAINTVVYSGEYEPACGFIAPNSPLASDQTLSCTEFDPEGARALMEQTGVDLPYRVELTFNQQPELRRMGEMIQQMAAEAGFEIVLNSQENTATVQAVQSGNFELYINSWSGLIDPDQNISRFAQSTSPASVGKYSNPRVDELIVAARSAVNDDDRIAAYDEIDRIIKEDVPFIYLVRPMNIFGHAANVGGLQYRATGTVVPTTAGFLAD